jgi:predicted  nucleic acid-binding Zn-ribbon protein
MKGENKEYLERARSELTKLRAALKTAKMHRDNLNQQIKELKAMEKSFVYLVEDLEEAVEPAH